MEQTEVLKPTKKKRKTYLTSNDIAGWLIILPSLLLFFFFIWRPLFESVLLSIYETDGYTKTQFVGLHYYKVVLNHPQFLAALRNTFFYIFWSLVIGFFVPIFAAILISETVHFKGLFRIGIYFPNVVPGVATVLIWRFFYKGESVGVLNIIMSKFGVEPQAWLQNTFWVIPFIILTATWKGFGATTLIYIANITNINPELYEAATIDGAGIRQRVWHITMPSILSLAKTLLILQVISVFQIMYEPMFLTNGGPNNKSLSIMQLVYNYAYRDFKYSQAAALSVIICIILIILSGIYMYATRTKKE